MLLLSDEPELDDEEDRTIYHVHAYTTDTQSAGTDANVYITIYGDKGNTGKTTSSFFVYPKYVTIFVNHEI